MLSEECHWTLLRNEDESTLVQVMAWCHQATSHYLRQCWPRSLSPYGVTRPQWVDIGYTSVQHWAIDLLVFHISISIKIYQMKCKGVSVEVNNDKIICIVSNYSVDVTIQCLPITENMVQNYCWVYLFLYSLLWWQSGLLLYCVQSTFHSPAVIIGSLKCSLSQCLHGTSCLHSPLPTIP